MELIEVIRLAYTMYTVYALLLLEITNFKAINVLPAVFLMWLIYFVFKMGNDNICLKSKSESDVSLEQHQNNASAVPLSTGKNWVPLLAILSIIFAILSAKFYTGQTPSSVISGLLNSNRSLYAEYQLHSKINNIADFTIKKIPYILMMFYTKFILFYTVLNRLVVNNRTTILEKISMIVMVFAHAYFGLARGTNYEFFEIVILVIFVTMSRMSSKTLFSKQYRKILFALLVVGVMVYLFYSRVTDRGHHFSEHSFPDHSYNEKSLIAYLSRDLAFLIMILYDYFGFGFYYTSTYLTKIWAGSMNGFLAGFLPKGYFFMEIGSIKRQINEHVFMGARWHPDVIGMIDTYGMLMSIVLVLLMGALAHYLMKERKTALNYLTQFMILMQMISFPTGNFVFISSASTLVVVLLSVVWTWRLSTKTKIKL